MTAFGVTEHRPHCFGTLYDISYQLISLVMTWITEKHSEIKHYGDVIMWEMASQIASLTIVCSTVYSGVDQRKHQSSTSLAFVMGIHRWPVSSPHKGPETRKNDFILWPEDPWSKATTCPRNMDCRALCINFTLKHLGMCWISPGRHWLRWL